MRSMVELGPSWKITYSCSLSPFWRVHSGCGPHPFGYCFQQTTSIHTPSHPGCHHTESINSFLQEIKRDIIYRRAQLQEPRRREELHPRIQAHLISVINKISSLLEYQGTLQFADGPTSCSDCLELFFRHEVPQFHL
jgi:hypothetical protein